ncbi:MAG: cupin domain-containing protein [Acidimicrobiaceae bacterium]|nr:cupin domain-containing protein [Acidimicrobiaceae bacterium]MYG98847.1 cupin domain-containing protein [Acidimicrobiaceae bacterium]MYL02676.1 cupin domain-containing protein [Acidimicrobiaceae bacterium]
MSTSGDAALGPSEFARRVIEPGDFVADRSAFVDVRLPRSAGKASYSLIGPGVSQNPEQVVNLPEAHGFHLGAASMDHGVVNNQHMHFTAEVFICTRGLWRMRIGEHGQQTLDISEGTVFSVPTWVFRGFENIGPDDGWLFAVLGGNETGGIVWAPDVLRAAAETGLFLGADGTVIDASDGSSVNGCIEPLEESQLSSLDSYSDDELVARTVRFEDLAWSGRSLLSSAGQGRAGSSIELAPVIGYGMTEDRRHQPPITIPHGFSIEWLRAAPGASFGLHRLARHQAAILTEGSWEVAVNRGSSRLTARPQEGSVVSMPPGVWRDFLNVGESEACALMVCNSQERPRVEWDESLAQSAAANGWRRDASGYLAPATLVAGASGAVP